MNKINMKIPVKIDKHEIGTVTSFNKLTGEVTIVLDMSKVSTRLIAKMMEQGVSINVSFNCVPYENENLKYTNKTGMSEKMIPSPNYADLEGKLLYIEPLSVPAGLVHHLDIHYEDKK